MERITITYEPPEEPTVSSTEHDPWNRWVFRTSLGASMAAEDRSDEYSLRASQSISRVTDGLKLALSLFGRYEESNFDTSDRTSVTSVTESYQGAALLV